MAVMGMRAFILGGSVPPTVRTRYLKRVNEELADFISPIMQGGNVIAVTGPSQAGKSTLLYSLADRLQKVGLPVIISLGSLALTGSSITHAWAGINTKVQFAAKSQGVSLNTADAAGVPLSSELRLKHHLQLPRRAVLLIDEFAMVGTAPVDVKDSILHTLRDLVNTDVLRSIVVAGPCDILTYSTSPTASAAGSAAWSVQHPYRMPPFKKSHIRSLLHSYAAEGGIPVAGDVVTAILDATQGHRGLGHPRLLCHRR